MQRCLVSKPSVNVIGRHHAAGRVEVGSVPGMAYKFLGMAVWKGAKLFLRRRYGPTYAPKPLLAGGLALVVAGVALIALQRRDHGA